MAGRSAAVAVLLIALSFSEAYALNGATVLHNTVSLRTSELTKRSTNTLRLKGGSAEPTLERTFAIIKPDAMAAGSAPEIKKMITDNGFLIAAEKEMTLSQSQAQNFYIEHKGKPFYEGLVAFMTSGPVTVLLLQKKGAIKGWRELMGPTNSIKARAEAKNSIRALFGTDGSKNAAHGSDSPKSAAREIGFFFGPFAWLKVVLPFAKLFWPKQ